MKQNFFCESNSYSVSQEISSILWKWKGHHIIDDGPPPVRMLSEINTIQFLSHQF